MELFDKEFVRFMWDDELEGKEVFVADNINSLIERVEKGASIYKVRWSRDNGMPFEGDDLVRYRFAYYDPNYEVKKAFNEGKKVQYQILGGVDWGDIDSEEALECRIAEGRTFRAILNETNEDVEQAYFDAAKPREKRIEELENKLSEAKEILMKIAKSFDDMCFMNALSQAREFLVEQILEEVKE